MLLEDLRSQKFSQLFWNKKPHKIQHSFVLHENDSLMARTQSEIQAVGANPPKKPWQNQSCRN